MSEHRSAGAFEDDVTAALRRLPPDDLTAPGLAGRVPVLARRRRTRRVVAAVAAATVTVVLGVPVVPALVGAGPDPFRLVQPAGPVVPPPPVDSTQPYLLPDAPAVRPGTVLGLTVVNPLDGPAGTWGVGGTLDRWDGRRWRRIGVFVVSTGDVQGGRVLLGQDSVAAPALGIDARARSGGPRESVSLVGLGPGTYRFVHDAAVLDSPVAGEVGRRDIPGIVEVRDDAPDAPSLERTGPVSLGPPTVVPSGEAGPVPLEANPLAAVDEAGVRERLAGLDHAAVERLDGGRWVPVAGAGRVAVRPRDDAAPYGFTVTLPALATGVYRLVATPAGGLSTAVFRSVAMPAGTASPSPS